MSACPCLHILKFQAVGRYYIHIVATFKDTPRQHPIDTPCHPHERHTGLKTDGLEAHQDRRNICSPIASAK